MSESFFILNLVFLQASPRSLAAHIILLDQFSRHIHRGLPQDGKEGEEENGRGGAGGEQRVRIEGGGWGGAKKEKEEGGEEGKEREGCEGQREEEGRREGEREERARENLEGEKRKERREREREAQIDQNGRKVGFYFFLISGGSLLGHRAA